MFAEHIHLDRSASRGGKPSPPLRGPVERQNVVADRVAGITAKRGTVRWVHWQSGTAPPAPA